MDVITVNVDKLRDDLTNDYGTAMFNGFPMAVMDLQRIESLSDYELCEYAQKKGIDLKKYKV